MTLPPSIDPAPDRHRAAVARTLQWADGCAARGEYADGLGWLALIEELGDTLPLEYEAKRRAWAAYASTRQQPDGIVQGLLLEAADLIRQASGLMVDAEARSALTAHADDIAGFADVPHDLINRK